MSIGSRWVRSLSLLLDSISDLFPVLHPRHKLKYFKNAGWSEKRCRAAYVVTRDTYEMYYKNKLCSEQPVLSDNVRHSHFLCYHSHGLSLIPATSKIVLEEHV